jgi:hypothetical protein
MLAGGAGARHQGPRLRQARSQDRIPVRIIREGLKLQMLGIWVAPRRESRDDNVRQTERAIAQKRDLCGAQSLRILPRKRVTKPVIDTQFQFIDLLFHTNLGRSEVGIGKCHVVRAKVHIIPLAED